jgi:hypothetical protein
MEGLFVAALTFILPFFLFMVVCIRRCDRGVKLIVPKADHFLKGVVSIATVFILFLAKRENFK